MGKPCAEGLSREPRALSTLAQLNNISLCSIMKNTKLSIDEKRTFEVKVRLNRKEKDKLGQVIQSCQTHAPDVFRSLLMKNKFPKPKPPMLDYDIYDQLRRIGINLNQYVKAIHERKLSEIDRLLLQELTVLIRIVRTNIVSK